MEREDDMNTTRETRWPRLLAAVLAVCLVLPLIGCKAGGEPPPAPDQAVLDPQPVTETERLKRLCKVWGYVKYTHPVFLLGQEDWDEDLLALIPQVRELETDQEVNELLHEWFVSLGEIDYGTTKPVALWAEASKEDRLEITDTSWTRDAACLGEDLAGDLGQLGEIPDVRRTAAPVRFDRNSLFQVTYPIFSKEQSYPDMDYSDSGYRLLGLFRMWNALEYYFPYHDLLERDWDDCLDELIPAMLEGDDQPSYGVTLMALSAGLHDNHAAIATGHQLEMALYGLAAASSGSAGPIPVTEAEGKLVVSGTAEDCPLEPGDVIVRVNGMEVEEFAQQMKSYLSCARDEMFLSMYADGILTMMWGGQEAEVTVLRDGREETFVCGIVSGGSALEPYLLLEGNIGLINPEAIRDEHYGPAMELFRETDGLVIDLRQYNFYALDGLSSYFTTEHAPVFLNASPSGAVPGTYVKTVKSDGYRPEDAQRGVYHYDKPVVVLVNEHTQSAGESAAWTIGKGEKVVLMGQNTSGAFSRVAWLPLPGNLEVQFTAARAELDDGSQLQRVGITPDIPVSRTIQGIKEGRDELMEAAIAYIRTGK